MIAFRLLMRFSRHFIIFHFITPCHGSLIIY